jgi:hypothetical protein
MTLGIVGLAIGAVGPGTWSLDHTVDLTDDLTGTSREHAEPAAMLSQSDARGIS